MTPLQNWKRRRDIGDVSHEVGIDLGGFDDDLDGVDEPPQELFDLSLRGEHLVEDKMVWAAPAMELALKIRHRDVRTIDWWHPLVTSPAVALPGVRLSQATGLYSFQVDRAVCQQLLDFLQDPSNYDEEGFLKMAGTQWPGYGSYPYVHAGIHVPSLQERKTVRCQNKQAVTRVLQQEPFVRALLEAVRQALGLPAPVGRAVQAGGKCVRAMHFLLQDETQQAAFSWHSDVEDLQASSQRTSDMTTVIVNLTDELTGMRLWGCAPHCYEGQGSAVAFHGAALHESLPRLHHMPADSGVWKVAFFFC